MDNAKEVIVQSITHENCSGASPFLPISLHRLCETAKVKEAVRRLKPPQRKMG